MKVIRHGSNVHELQIEGKETKIAMLSDLHWDNPKCDRDLLKKHLDYCKEENIPVMVNGDFFCLMQGRGDNRRNKSDIRPEHNNSKYLDSIVTTAVEWFEPYADILTVIGYGNHETGQNNRCGSSSLPCRATTWSTRLCTNDPSAPRELPGRNRSSRCQPFQYPDRVPGTQKPGTIPLDTQALQMSP